MTQKLQAAYIWAIISQLKYHAYEKKKKFDMGDTFFKLIFLEDKELLKIAALCGIK